ncbi:MAG: SRPBCC family protein, partial [Pseudomonadota bacterium]
MKIIKTITINAPIDTVWKAIATEYEHAGRWSSAVYASTALTGQAVGDAPVQGRVCETTLGPF